MKGGTLEVFLVKAEDIRHTNILGTPVYYVITQLGSYEHRSKVSKGKDATVLWNEKFKFECPMEQWKKLSHIKFRIMDREFFSDGGFVGETIIHLGGIISEGNYRGFIEVKPAPYNVVIEDDSYKGRIKIGFRFIPNVHSQMKVNSPIKPHQPRQSICKSVSNNIWRFFCSRLSFLSSENKHKHD